MNSLGQNGDVFEEVDATTLDEFFASSSGLNRYDFLKVDVEGAEELVFRGAVETLTGYRPIIIFECNPGAAERMGLSADGAWQFLQSLGYDMSILVSGGTRRETLGFTKPPTARNAWNAIAVHPESKAYAR